MKERIINYIDMSEKQKQNAFKHLIDVGFVTQYGNKKSIKAIMEKSDADSETQFYFVFRDELLIGFLFLIGDEEKFKEFPYLSISNMDEQKIELCEAMIKIQIDFLNILERNILQNKVCSYYKIIGTE